MERIAVFVNDEAYASPILVPLLGAGPASGPWTVVLCPPQMTQRIGKWLSERQRRQWRQTWSQGLRLRLQPVFEGAVSADRLEWVTAAPKLAQTAAVLHKRHGPSLRMLDLRRRHVGDHLRALGATAGSVEDAWKAPVAVSSTLSMVLALVD